MLKENGNETYESKVVTSEEELIQLSMPYYRLTKMIEPTVR